MESIFPILQNISYGAVVVLFAWFAKLIADWRTTDINDDYQIEEKSNLAIGVRRAGLYLGGMIAMVGVLTGASQGYLNDLFALLVYGSLAYVLLFIARYVNDAIILHGIDNDGECKKANSAVGIVEFGNYIATGLVVYGCMVGDSAGLFVGIRDTILFFVIGQVVLVTLAYFYELITPFKCVDEIRSGNNAAAIMLAGKTIALGLILKNSIAGESVGGLGADVKSFAISAVVGIICLFVFNKVIDKLFLPNTDIATEVERDRNVAAVTVTQIATIGFALIISTVI